MQAGSKLRALIRTRQPRALTGVGAVLEGEPQLVLAADADGGIFGVFWRAQANAPTVGASREAKNCWQSLA